MTRLFQVNAIGPALVAKHFPPRMPRHGRAVFAALSAKVGIITDNRLGGWYGYRASKAALNWGVRDRTRSASRCIRAPSIPPCRNRSKPPRSGTGCSPLRLPPRTCSASLVS